MDNNPVSDPTPMPGSEPTPSLGPTQTPDLVPTVESTQEPAPTSTITGPAPTTSQTTDVSTTISPFQPNTANPTVGTPTQGNKKLSSKLIGIIAGAGILLLGLAIVLILHFISCTPEKVFSSAMDDLLTKNYNAFKATADISSDDGNMAYGLDYYSPDNDTVYLRISGLGEIYKSLFLLFGVELNGDFTSKMQELEQNWWKVETKDSTQTSSFSNLVPEQNDDRAKVVEAYKKSPFLTATRATDGKSYSTSGDAYVVSVDIDKYEAFKAILQEGEVEDSSLTLGPVGIDNRTEDFVITIKSSFFGGGVVTGLYQESIAETSTQKVSIDFEHAIKTEPTNAKSISELTTALTELFGDSSIDEGGSNVDDPSEDGQRRKDYGNLFTSITKYMTNNSGELPETGTLNARIYINVDGLDPIGAPYILDVVEYDPIYPPVAVANDFGAEVYVVLHASCNGDDLIASSSEHAFAIYGALSSGVYCEAN
ncbi:hypothetical protein IK146_01100 [Candidatus Saccharibacteria bacterium]|nr:hypothetical protein [Candidatus Saccharibacteria bacterium]